ncbi:MAG TPA: glycosyltransferase family 4 protein [Thermoleophilaceae bacterium]|nr:glycosyltransferase family 4 protein [Thermoleophilaceae bacterium]
MAPCYWPEVRRGTERFTRELADGLVAHGRRPTLVTSHPGRPSRTVEDGLRVIRLPRPPSGALDRRLYEDHLTHLPLSAAAVLALRPTVAHALYPTDGVAAGVWSRLTGRPSVLSYMGIPEASWLERKHLRRRTLARAAAGCDAVVALSRTAAAEFRATLGVEARVIAPGVDLEAFSPGGQRAPEPTIFCAASILTPAKRVHELLAAFPAVRARHPRARLLLSRPADVAAAEALVAGAEGVELVDVDDRAALRDAYRAAWVSVLPSVGEAFGLVLVESMACGTPVVGRRAGAIAEVVDRPSVGVLFDGGPDDLAGALEEALELAERAETPAATRAHAEGFSTAACTGAYEDLYEELEAARKELDARGRNTDA